ncbi:MAG: hypothetical protein WC835_02920 [Candidatus Paceibacterota bacterium]|jgi:hypothetical protein
MYTTAFTLPWLALILILAFFSLAFANMMAGKWSRLPQFKYNRVGGVLAVCSVASFNRAVAAGSVAGGFVVVPETIIFSNSSGKEQYVSGATCWTSDDGQMPKSGPGLYPLSAEKSLFVPFTSEARMSYAEQEKFFIGPQDPEKFALEMRRLNDWRLHYAEWAEVHHLGRWTAVFGAVLVAVIFVGMIATSYSDYRKEMEESIVVYTTDGDGVHETRATGRESIGLLMYHSLDEEFKLIRGKVVKAQPIGGGSAIACIARVGENTVCGFASSGLQIGDEAFRRIGRVMTWTSGTGKVVSHHELAEWFITRKEVEALMATGKFKIVD